MDLVSNFINCEDCGVMMFLPDKSFCCGVDYKQKRRDFIQSELSNNSNSVLIAKRTTRQTKRKIKVKRKKPSRKKIDDSVRMAVLKRDKNRCVKCKSKTSLHLHHIVEVANGGSDTVDNLKTLCELCHAEEHRGQTVYNLMIKRLFQVKSV